MRKSITREGPDINLLHHRLMEFPTPWRSQRLPSYFYALIHDTVYARCDAIQASDLQLFKRSFEQCTWYRASLLIAYFLMDSSFNAYPLTRDVVLDLLENTAKELSLAGPNSAYIDDVDRREEFIRVVLFQLNLRPKGETDAQAEDRLQAVSSKERQKVLKAAKLAEQRANDLRRALAEKKAKEAADKMTRE